MRRSYPLDHHWQLHRLGAGLDEHAAVRGNDDADDWYAVRLPSGVHEVLLREGDIPDPSVDDQATQAQWVGEADWILRRRFETPAPGTGPSLLTFESIDTLGEVYLNGVLLGRTANQYVPHRFDDLSALAPVGEENVLSVVLRSAAAWVDGLEQPAQDVDRVPRNYYLRKGAGDFAVYLGARPRFIHVGLPGSVRIETTERARLETVHVRTELTAHADAVVTAAASIGGDADGAVVRWRLDGPDGATLAAGDRPAGGDWRTELTRPALWWPRGYGAQALHTLHTQLVLDDTVVDERTTRVGIRTTELRTADPETGEPRFQLVVNGVPVYAMGACWIPLTGITHAWDHDRARRLLDLAENAGMNTLRVWGGGLYPDERFYDECDRRGILLWQDFMFDYWMYPAGHPAFETSVAGEFESVVARLQTHPSVAMWCGGNEDYMAWQFFYAPEPEPYGDLYEERLPKTVARLDGTRPYHVNSPIGGEYAESAGLGDWHDYCWNMYSPGASVPLFASEIGRLSAPSPKSMRKMLTPESLWPAGHEPRIVAPGQAAWPQMWEYRSAPPAWEKVGRVQDYPDPVDAESLIRVLGTAHGEYLRDRIERQRRGVPDGAAPGPRRNAGSVIWRLNDSWPILYWSVIDAYLEPKIAYYFLRRTFAPVLLSVEVGADSIRVWVVNDSIERVTGTLEIVYRAFTGEERGRIDVPVDAAPGQSVMATDLDALGLLKIFDAIVEVRLGDRVVTQLLAPERFLQLPQARLQAHLDGDAVVVASDVFARQVVVETDTDPGVLVLEENHLDLAPGQSVRLPLSGTAAGATITVGALNAAAPVTLRL